MYDEVGRAAIVLKQTIMTRIDFYTQLVEPLSFACQLVKRVYRSGERMLVWLSDDRELTAFSQRLWCAEDIMFIPHCRFDAAEADETPILLTTTLPVPVECSLMLNLCQSVPDASHRFTRILEVIAREESSVLAGRGRFRYYRQQGYTIEHHDMSHKVSKR